MYEYKSKILRVIDGDTVDVDIDLGFNVILSLQRIRLYGIDTPESRTRDLEEKKYGLLAKQMVKDYCAVGQTIALRTRKDDRGKFGRILGELMVYDAKTDSTRSLNQMLIENYLAVPYVGQSKDDIKDQHLKNRELFEKKNK